MDQNTALMHGMEGIGYIQRMGKMCIHCQLEFDAIILNYHERSLDPVTLLTFPLPWQQPYHHRRLCNLSTMYNRHHPTLCFDTTTHQRPTDIHPSTLAQCPIQRIEPSLFVVPLYLSLVNDVGLKGYFSEHVIGLTKALLLSELILAGV
ncbi:predicted protein [Lichtheimia corymbifera JMRC:FSU:9682]|uniref:Uncharacterized protein n=1 Tax=Lichtheimia corymbifera JMRC:FSU:9682 TaxID=1263082 RepID=A0A068S849_9FUNG|nr:predicted protein [Lichtheimia corymbifera JMRC:FSU:9682]